MKSVREMNDEMIEEFDELCKEIDEPTEWYNDKTHTTVSEIQVVSSS